MRIAIIVPFLNEADNLPVLLESIVGQTRPPDQLLLVDDGSTDGSSAIAQAFVDQHQWASVARRDPRELGPDRLAGGAAARAFLWGVERLREPWDVLAKIDADLELTPPTVACIEEALGADPQLGITGAYLSCPDENGVPIRHRGRSVHVDGATKFYRRACWEAIGGVPLLLGWDTIDEVRAHLRGWSTGPISVPGGDPLHRRPMSSHDGILRGYRRRGTCGWTQGEPFVHALGMGIQRLGDRPRVLAGTNYVIGWLMAAARRGPRAEPEVVAAVRRNELMRLRRRARRELGHLLHVG